MAKELVYFDSSFIEDDEDMDYCDYDFDPCRYDCSMSPGDFMAVRDKLLTKKKAKVHKVGTSVPCTKKFINAIRHCSDFSACFYSISNNEIHIKVKLKRKSTRC